MKQAFFGKTLLCLTMIFAGAVSSADAQGEVTINGSIGSGKLERGKTATVTVTLNIPSGWHVNSSKPLNEYAIPTRIKLSGAGLKFGAVVYPNGRIKRFAFSDGQIAIYEGSVTLRATVIVPENFKGKAAKIRAVVSYQSCTDEVCFQPRAQNIILSAIVK